MPFGDDEHTESEERLGEVVTAYLDALGDGLVPDRRQFLVEYAELAPELEEFFTAQDQVALLTSPLRAVAQAATLPQFGAAARLRHAGEIGVAADTRLTAVLESRGYDLLGDGVLGGGAVVYKARQRRLNRLVAVKTIGVGHQVSPRDLQRFRNEAETLGSLVHPNIVPVYEVAEHDGRLFLFMPYLQGGSLAEHLTAYRADPRAAVRLLATASRAVHHAHRHGVLHRDLKPSNILLDTAGEPQVADFGLSTRLGVDSTLTVSGAIVGTPSFMAPEQTQGRRGALTTSTDVYGLGAILYALLTGRPPFRGETAIDTIEMVRTTPPIRPSAVSPRVDSELETICLKCLDKEPKERYASAEGLADDLDRWLRGEPIEARPVGRVVKAWRWARRNRALAGWLGLVGALVIAGIVGLVAANDMLSRRNAVIAQRNAEIARERDQAKQAVEDMYTQVAEKWLAYEPRMEPVRREFLIKALRFYQQLALEKGSDAQSRDDVAKAYSRVAQIHSLLGELDLAEQSYRKAAALFEGLAVDHPREPAYQYGRLDAMLSLAKVLVSKLDKEHRDEAEGMYRQAIELCRKLGAILRDDRQVAFLLARAHSGLSEILRSDGPLAEAVQSSRRSLSLVEELCRRFADEASYREHLAQNQHQLGTIFYTSGQKDDAARYYRNAISTYDKLVAGHPADPKYRAAQAGTLHGLAMVLHQLGDFKGAESSYRSAIELREKLSKDFPAVPEHHVNLAKHCAMFAALLANTNRPKEAEEAQRKSARMAETLVRDFPDTAEFRLLRAGCQLNLAGFLMNRDQLPEAGDILRRSLSQLEALPPRHAGVAELQSTWGMTAHNFGELLRRQGDDVKAQTALEQAVAHQQEAVGLSHAQPMQFERLTRLVAAHAEQLFAVGKTAEALRAIAMMIKAPSSEPMIYYHLSVFLANWSAQMVDQPKLPLPHAQRRELAQFYADQAVDNLRKAVEVGLKDLAFFNRQGFFDRLRARADFKAIVRELESKQRTALEK